MLDLLIAVTKVDTDLHRVHPYITAGLDLT